MVNNSFLTIKKKLVYLLYCSDKNSKLCARAEIAFPHDPHILSFVLHRMFVNTTVVISKIMTIKNYKFAERAKRLCLT